MLTPIENNTALLETVMGKINGVSSEVNTQATQIEDITSLLEGKAISITPTTTQATPSISLSSGGLITASSTQSAGYVAAGTKSATKQLDVQAAQTITPGTIDKTIASGKYLTGTQTIKGDSNLVAENIAEGVSIFGITGTHSGGAEIELLTMKLGLGGFGNATFGTIYYQTLDEYGNIVNSTAEIGTSSRVIMPGYDVVKYIHVISTSYVTVIYDQQQTTTTQGGIISTVNGNVAILRFDLDNLLNVEYNGYFTYGTSGTGGALD